ncbi:Thiol:disulfide interchange protein DsbD [Burkholderiales bacterium]|nr:Thiol:disulfide interchange protein DsbD [Burkholderiales bacterium]
MRPAPLAATPSRRARAFAAALALVAVGAVAAPVRTQNVEAELVPVATAAVPGQPVTVALRLKMREGWHTYWRNPGDSGLPTTIDWKLPPGVTAGPIDWPAPHALPVGPLVNYGYEGEVLLPSTLSVAADAAPGSELAIAARADWLVCKETCIPEGADLTLALPVATAASPHPDWGAPIAATIAALPQPLAGWTASATGEGQRVRLALAPPAGAADPGKLYFFPNDEGRIEASAPQALARDGASYVLSLPVAYQLAPGFTRVAGVVSAPGGFGGANFATIDIPLAGSVVAGPKPVDAPVPAIAIPAPAGAASMSLLLAALLAFAGGAILNLMPCVLPVLSIKVLGFAAHHDSRATMRREGLAYGAGVLVTFVGLAVALLALRAAGEQLGWGFQLQSPVFVSLLAVLFFALALNLSGVFEFGQFAPASVLGWTSRNRTLDAFATGVLAVVIASPCTAPFMGAALGFALVQPAAVTIAVFVALGTGMALPYVLLAWFPTWRRALPKPGAWMIRFKQLLAFPLYATVAWLAWVLGTQIDVDAVLRLSIALIAVAFALWAWHVSRLGPARPWKLSALAALAVAVFVAGPLAATSMPAPPPARSSAPVADAAGWQGYTPARLAELSAAGPVFVDFTAAWCITCQVNKRLVLSDRDVLGAFADRKVALLRADWTRRDPDITRALAALGRNGVPVYVLYRPGREPLLLPEVLTTRTVSDALATLDGPALAQTETPR